MYHKLEKEKGITKTLKMLTTSVSHEMIGPLSANIQIAERLFKKVRDKEFKKMI